MKKTKVVIGIPMLDRIPADFFQSMLTINLKDIDGKVSVEAGSLVYTARNSITAHAAEVGAEYVFWLDSDIVFPRNALQILLEDARKGHLDYVSGLYFKRALPTAPVIAKELVWEKTEKGSYNAGAVPYTDYPQGKLFEIAGSGFGCCLTSVEALLAVTEQFKMSPFEPLPNLGEDYSFCKRFAQIGGKMWCDSRVKCGHVGKYVYDEKVWLEQESEE